MTATPSSPLTCAFCDKQGLPILPVRYAIARTDLGHAPPLPASFGAGVTAIALPAQTARYTLRLLRPGYLYVYDEHRDEWSGYVVNGQSYLWEFDIHARTPPAVDHTKTFTAACQAKSDPYIARCITVKHAARATRVWLGFSDVAWTPAVLARHASADYRQATMQCIDMAAWRQGGVLPHVTDFDALDHVAEFAADGIALQKETRRYVQAFFPAPYELPEDITAPHGKAQAALRTLSPMVQQLLVGAVGRPATQGAAISAAWAFSPHTLHLAGEDTAAMRAWGKQSAQPYRPAIVGITDPIGIAMALNGLAIQRSVEFTDDKSRRWKYETAQLIAAVKEAIGHGAVEDDIQSRQLAAAANDAWTVAKLGFPTPGGFEAYRARIDQAGTLDAAQQDAVIGDTWARYATCIHEDAWEGYLGTAARKGIYQDDLDTFADRTLKPLDAAYLAWLKSPALRRCLAHSFDPHDLRSGEAYLDVVRLLIAEAGGRSAVFQWLAEVVQHDPRQPEAWLMRALALNHEPLIQAWSAAALDKATEPALSWVDLVESFYEAYKDIVGDAIDIVENRPRTATYADKIARLVYQVAGPLTRHISEGIDQGLAATFPTRFQMGVLGTVAKLGNPDLAIVDLRGSWTRKEAARTLAGMLANLSGDPATAYRSGVRTALDRLHQAEGAARPYVGVMLIDTAKARRLAGTSRAERDAALHDLLTPQQFDEIMQESIGRLFHLDVKTGVVQLVLSAVTLRNAYREMMQADPDEAVNKAVNFAGGVIGIIGGASVTVGKGLEATHWGAARLAKQYKFLAIEIETRAAWLTGVGTLFGAAGGIIAGALAIDEGWGGRASNHSTLAGWTTFAGAASIAISLAPILFTIEAVGSFALGIAGIVVAAVLAVVAWLKPNAVQDWLERSTYFGKGSYKFESPASQLQALHALVLGA